MALSRDQKEQSMIAENPISNPTKKKIINASIRVLLVLTLLFVGDCIPVAATPMYVVDVVKLGVRNKPDKNENAIYIIQTADEVELVQSQDQWALIKIDDQRRGWVLKSYLTPEPPLRFQHQKITALNHQLQAELASVQENQQKMTAAKEKLEKRVEALNRQIAQADQQPTVKTTESAVYRKLKTENERLTLELAQLKEGSESSNGFLNITQRDYLFFFTGTFVFLMGILMGYVARKKRRSSLLG